MEDIVEEVVDYLRLNTGAVAVQSLLGANPETKITADFDPQNVSRPNVFVLLPHNPTKYKALGNTVRVETPILSILCFTDTRAESIALLNSIESALIQYSGIGLGPPTVEDKVSQLDLSRIDAWKGTMNLSFFVQQNQEAEG